MLGDNSSTVDALDEGAFFEVFSVTPGKGDADYFCPKNWYTPLKDFREFDW